jgi:hypothetical protein
MDGVGEHAHEDVGMPPYDNSGRLSTPGKGETLWARNSRWASFWLEDWPDVE